MCRSLFVRIRRDLAESQITVGVMLAMIPIALFTYLFHEFGHWILGELMGNAMTFSLNTSTPKNGHFLTGQDSLVSAIGGPLFTIVQATVFLIVTRKSGSVYAYSMVFMAAFSRFFSIIFGGISRQDEFRIASMLNVNEYWVALIVLFFLFMLLWRSSWIMHLHLKAVGYFTTLCTFAMLIIIGINSVIDCM